MTVSMSFGIEDKLDINNHRVPTEVFNTLVDRYNLEVTPLDSGTEKADMKLGNIEITFFHWTNRKEWWYKEKQDQDEQDRMIAEILGISLYDVRKSREETEETEDSE